MSLAGVWNLDGRPLRRSVIDRVLAPLASGERHLWREGAVCLAVLPSGPAPTTRRPVASAGGVVLTFDGRLDDRHGLVDALGTLPDADELMSDGDLILAAYDRWGDGLADHLVGEYALALFDPRRQWLLLARDPSGARPLHYLRLPDTMAYASRIDALLAHPGGRRAPNAAVLSRLVLGGAPQADSGATTAYDGVYSVPPGHVAALTRGRFVTRRFADPALRDDRRPGEIGAVVDAAVARRVREGPVVVDLGEWAAESLIGAAVRHGADVIALLPPGRRPPAAASDVIELARPPLAPIEVAQASLAITESPRLDPWLPPRQEALERAVERGASVQLSAAGAKPMLSDDAYLADLVRRLAVREALREVPGSRRERVRAVGDAVARGMVPGLLQQPARSVRAYVRGPLRDADWYTSSFRLWALKASTRERWQDLPTHSARGVYAQARSVALQADVEARAKLASRVGLEAAFPFLDPEVIATVMAIPGQRRAPGGDARALLPVPPGPPPEDVSGPLLLVGWEECRRRFLRVGAAVQAGYVDGAMLESELDYLRDDIADGHPTAAHRLMDLLGLELWLESLETPGLSGSGAIG